MSSANQIFHTVSTTSLFSNSSQVYLEGILRDVYAGLPAPTGRIILMPVEDEALEHSLDIGARLNFIIETVGINISQLSDILNVKRKTIYSWIDGVTPRKQYIKHIDKIAIAFENWDLNNIKLGGYLYKLISDNESLYSVISNKDFDIEHARKIADQILKFLQNFNTINKVYKSKSKKSGSASTNNSNKRDALNRRTRKA